MNFIIGFSVNFLECTTSMDVAFVLDFSGSLDDVVNITIQLTYEIVEGLPFTNNRVRVALVSFSDEATLHFDLNEYTTKPEILNALAFR